MRRFFYMIAPVQLPESLQDSIKHGYGKETHTTDGYQRRSYSIWPKQKYNIWKYCDP